MFDTLQTKNSNTTQTKTKKEMHNAKMMLQNLFTYITWYTTEMDLFKVF